MSSVTEDELFKSLARQMPDVKAQGALPPVASWNPAHCGDSEIRIAADGKWYHQGDPISRPEMVRLFSRILRREPDGRFVLVTPVEKLGIEVEDAPFVAMGIASEGQGKGRSIGFWLNTGEMVIADAGHDIRITAGAHGPRPYIHVRNGLEALIARGPYYELAHWAIEEAADPPGVWSNGAFFALESMS